MNNIDLILPILIEWAQSPACGPQLTAFLAALVLCRVPERVCLVICILLHGAVLALL